MHFGPPGSGLKDGIQRKLISESERLMKTFVEEMNTQEHPEFVVNLGDSIEDVNAKETDIQYFKKTVEILSRLKMPLYTLIGNHDVRTLTEKEVASMLGYEKMYYSFDNDSYHFIALSFEMTGDHTHNLADIRAEIPQEQLQWLKDDLSKADKPVIIFIHYGLAEDDMKENFWFEEDPHYALLNNRAEIRKIIEDSGKVKAIISAHQHWNRMKVHNNIPYFTVTSMVENTKNDNVAAEAYTIVNLDKERIELDVKGNDPAHFEFELS